MAVIIDMDMPKSCAECTYKCSQPMSVWEDSNTDYTKTRYFGCPLKSADETFKTEYARGMYDEMRKWEKKIDKMIAEIEDYNVRENFEGCTTTEYMLGVARGLDISADIAYKHCGKENTDE